MIVVVLAHFLLAVVVLAALRRRPMLATISGCALMVSSAVSIVVMGIGADAPRIERWVWVDGLGLSISFRLDGFAVMMALLVSVLGALVLWYSSSYFDHGANSDQGEKYVRFVGLFLAFAGAMTGVVLSADLFSMFVFWELTSVCSFLLIGLDDQSPSARASALRALLVTSAGGLCLLGGVTLLQVFAGTTSFAELASSPPTGTAITTAIVLVLMGAFTKSAQVPFHFWLPGAMAAPTPVSAYLHSATMVKAGIVLMARMAPVFGDQPTWRWLVVIAGGTTMVLGGAQALRQVDAKLLLAHSTVAQLGFLTVLVGFGVPGATYAGIAHLVAHALFKASLFLSVGIVDHSTGTRDIRRMSGLAKEMPVLAALAGLAALSMAGVIPLLGFATKEKALVALLDADAGAVGVIALAAVIGGSVLSVAYSVRLWFGLFGIKEVPADLEAVHVHHHAGVSLMVPAGILAAASLAGGLAAGVVGGWLGAPAASLDAAAGSYHLVLWPGINTEFLISIGVIVVGWFVGRAVPWSIEPSRVPFSGERIYQFLLDGLLQGSRRLTAVTQSGSLLAYLGVVMLVLVVVLGVAVVHDPGGGFEELVLADSPTQLLVAVIAVVFAFAVVLTRQRFVAALLIGGVGFGCAVLFALFGAPDLALTQVLVETLTIVVFLLVLRQMPRHFSADPVWAPKFARIVVSVGVGVGVALFAVMVSGARTGESAGDVYTPLSLPEAGGKNVVNVILVDFRGWDTMGEITVLGIAALGVTNLVRMARRRKLECDDAAELSATSAPGGSA